MSNPFIKKQLDFIVRNIGLTDIYEIDKIRYGLEVFCYDFNFINIRQVISVYINDNFVNANKTLYRRKSC